VEHESYNPQDGKMGRIKGVKEIFHLPYPRFAVVEGDERYAPLNPPSQVNAV
jgi:hypothetical protein